VTPAKWNVRRSASTALAVASSSPSVNVSSSCAQLHVGDSRSGSLWRTLCYVTAVDFAPHATSPASPPPHHQRPRMAVRSALPWPFRWAVRGHRAGVLCGHRVCGPLSSARTLPDCRHGSRKQSWPALRAQRGSAASRASARRRSSVTRRRSIANTAGTLVTAEKACQGAAGVAGQADARRKTGACATTWAFSEKADIHAGASEGVAIRDCRPSCKAARR